VNLEKILGVSIGWRVAQRVLGVTNPPENIMQMLTILSDLNQARRSRKSAPQEIQRARRELRSLFSAYSALEKSCRYFLNQLPRALRERTDCLDLSLLLELGFVLESNGTYYAFNPSYRLLADHVTIVPWSRVRSRRRKGHKADIVLDGFSKTDCDVLDGHSEGACLGVDDPTVRRSINGYKNGELKFTTAPEYSYPVVLRWCKDDNGKTILGLSHINSRFQCSPVAI